MGIKVEKQRKATNEKILSNLRMLLLTVNGLYILFRIMWNWDSFGFWNMMGYSGLLCSQLFAFWAIGGLCECKYDEQGELINGGSDLSLRGGVTEMYFDLVYSTSILEVLLIISDTFWYFWICIPGIMIYQFYSIYRSSNLIRALISSNAQKTDQSQPPPKQKVKNQKIRQ